MMIKTATITFHRAHNYGSALQAYALQTKLKSLGIDNTVIDFQKPIQRQMYSLFSKGLTYKSIRANLVKILYYRELKLHHKRFDDFINKNLRLTEYFSNAMQMVAAPLQYDKYICGSDQIWNLRDTADGDECYFLTFVDNSYKKVAYAPSIGWSDYEDEYKLKYKDLLKNFEYISVREETGANFLCELLNKKIETVLDPTLLLHQSDWDEIAVAPPIKGEYIFCYSFGPLQKMTWEIAKQLSKQTGLPIASAFLSKIDEVNSDIKLYDAGPCEFVGLIKNAKFICTSSFHGTVFSIIYHKDFLSSISGEKHHDTDSRKIDLLNKIGLGNRLIDRVEDIGIERFTTDYSTVEKSLQDQIEKSVSFLVTAINQ